MWQEAYPPSCISQLPQSFQRESDFERRLAIYIYMYLGLWMSWSKLAYNIIAVYLDITLENSSPVHVHASIDRCFYLF